MELSWRDIFDSQKVFPKGFYECSDIAKSVGYEYYAFNGRVYNVGTKSSEAFLCTVDDLFKMYVVTSDFGYDCNGFEGVFSTQEKAEEYVKLFNKRCGGGDIAEWVDVELDKP